MQLGYLKIFLYLIAAIALLGSMVKILKEYERAVIFRLGKLRGTRGPGPVFLIPLADRIERVDLRLVSIDVPRQDIMTRDNVPVTVDAVVYFQIIDPAVAVIGIQNIYQSTFLIAQTTLRNILGQVELDDLLSQQEKINQHLQQVISGHTKTWGIRIPIVEIKEVTLPEEMKRAMAKQAETERERRARIIDAQGEYQAAQTLAQAGQILSDNPQSLQLRYLQTLRDISTQKGSTILFPFPLDLISPFFKGVKEFFQGREDKEYKGDGHRKEPERKSQGEIRDDRPERVPPEGLFMEEKTPGPEEAVTTRKEPPIGLQGPPIGLQGPPVGLQGPPIGAGPSAFSYTPQQEMLNRFQQTWRERKLRPYYVQWLCTSRCQFQCAHCEITAGKKELKELTTAEAEKMIDALAELGGQFLSFTGGEPLLRTDIFSLIDHARKRGLKAGLTTNGQAVEDNLMALEEAGLDSVVITLDGYADTQNRLRGIEDAYKRGLQTIEFFHDLGAPSIGVSTILLEENIRELPRLTEDVFRAGAHTLQLQPLLSLHGQPVRNSSELVKNAFRFILEARRRGFSVEAGEVFGYLGPLEPMVRSAPFFCGCGWNTFCINPEGDIIGCAILKDSLDKEGNCRTDSVKMIWEQRFSSFRRNLPEGLSEGCRQCPHLSICRGGCWLLRAQGLNPCFRPEAEEIYQEMSDALYSQTAEGKSQVLPG